LEWAADHDSGAGNEELLELCKNQDQEALRVLLRRHERPVYSLLYRMLSSHEDAEEALAEVFVKVWRSAPGFKGQSKFTTWLYRIAANTARDCLRARKARPEVSIEDAQPGDVEVAQRLSSPTPDPAVCVIEAEDRARIAAAVKQLSEEDRLLITLYHFQECDYTEMAEITGFAAGNLKVKLFRARQKLRKLCADEEKDRDEDEMRRDTTESAGLRQGAAESV